MNFPPKKPVWTLYIAIFFHQIISGVIFPFAKIGLNQIEPFTFAFLRFAISTLVYIPILILLRNHEKMPLSVHMRLLLLGFLIIPVNQTLYLVGQSMTLASHGGLLFATTPIFVYIMAVFFLGEHGTIRKTIGILTAVAGVYLILSGGELQFRDIYVKGDLLVLVAAFAWAVATILAKPLAVKYGALRVTGYAAVYGSVLYFPYGIYRAAHFNFENVTPIGWFSVFYMSLVISVVAYFLWYWVLKYMEASRLAVIQNIQPIIASAAAFLILAEPVSTTLALGGSIVLVGVILTQLQ